MNDITGHGIVLRVIPLSDAAQVEMKFTMTRGGDELGEFYFRFNVADRSKYKIGDRWTANFRKSE